MSNGIPLYKQPNPLFDREPAPIGTATQKVCGANAGNLQYTDLDSINGCRMTKGTKPKIRVAAKVAPMSGHMRESLKRPTKHNPYSRKEMRRLAITVLRQRGDAITDANIQGILSGRTL